VGTKKKWEWVQMKGKKWVNILLAVSIVVLLAWVGLLSEPFTNAEDYNTTGLVNTSVNITNAAPFVYNVLAPTTIDLTAYGLINVTCNFTVYDFDNNTQSANATLHVNTVNSGSAADQNTLYRNSSCSRLTPIDYFTNFSCTFSVQYFANNGTWYCNATGIDSSSATTTNISNAAIINPLIAIKIDSILDFGQLGANSISNDTLSNITNVGNRNANISVKGYGVTENDGLAMTCDNGNIPVTFEKYDSLNGTAYASMTALTSASTMIRNFYVFQRTSETMDSINSTYWKLAIPAGAGGVCSGKILFTASDRGA
jgi:hypothetical protein